MSGFGLSVPANLLLLGEYAVTEKGGRGLALATAPRVRVSLHPAPKLSVRGRMGRSSFEWRAASGREAPPLLASCLATVGAALTESKARAGVVGGRIEIDSSAFFAPDGSKRGLGSSAAVALGLVAALLRGGGLGGEALEKLIFPLALEAHRGFQGGRGSGYDLAASRFGGFGLFIGGQSPVWRPLDPGALPALYLFAGRGSVSSAAAVAGYQAWRSAQPEARAAFLAASDRCVAAFLGEGGPPRPFLPVLEEAAGVGRELGDRIGFGASLEPPSGLPPGAVVKALGAGDELGLLALPLPLSGKSARDSLVRIAVDQEGLRWE